VAGAIGDRDRARWADSKCSPVQTYKIGTAKPMPVTEGNAMLVVSEKPLSASRVGARVSHP